MKNWSKISNMVIFLFILCLLNSFLHSVFMFNESVKDRASIINVFQS